MAEQNPGALLDHLEGQIMIDEIQQAPGLFSELKIRIDADRQTYDRWLLIGSQHFPLMKGVTESLAGRIGLIRLTTFAASELRPYIQDNLMDYNWLGGYPELWATQQMNNQRFYGDYIATYLEHDLRPLLHVQSLRLFDRLLRTIAARAGQLMNYESIATDVSLTAVTMKKWLTTLQISDLITILEPYFTNVTKRLIKTPKLFFNDHGLLCYLVGARSKQQWQQSPLQGALWENMVFGQLLRWAELKGWRDRLFFWRDKSGREVDFVLDLGDQVILVEAKVSQTPSRNHKIMASVAEELTAKGIRVHQVIACMTPTLMPMKHITLWNPLHHPVDVLLG